MLSLPLHVDNVLHEIELRCTSEVLAIEFCSNLQIRIKRTKLTSWRTPNGCKKLCLPLSWNVPMLFQSCRENSSQPTLSLHFFGMVFSHLFPLFRGFPVDSKFDKRFSWPRRTQTRRGIKLTPKEKAIQRFYVWRLPIYQQIKKLRWGIILVHLVTPVFLLKISSRADRNMMQHTTE